MTTHNSAHERRLRAYFEKELSAEEMSEVLSTTRGCPECRQAFERYAGAESALYASEISLASLDRVRSRVVPVPKRAFSWTPALATGLAALAAIGLFVVAPTEKMTARGGAGGLDQPATVRVVALSNREGSARVRDVLNTDELRAGDRLRFVVHVERPEDAPVLCGMLEKNGAQTELFRFDAKKGDHVLPESPLVDAGFDHARLMLVFSKSHDCAGEPFRTIELGVRP